MIPGRNRAALPQDHHNENLLLLFLSENSYEPFQPKTPNEQLGDILFRNLYNPNPPAFWKNLTVGTRILENVCDRPRLWEMVTGIMQVSPSLLGSKVCSASALYGDANNDSIGVSQPHK
jgi:hypothetical protein